MLSDDELKYVYKYIQEFTRFIHKDQVNTLKDIKKKIKKINMLFTLLKTTFL